MNTITAIFRKYPGIQYVKLYGSRAKGNYRPGSDIDITIFGDASFGRTELGNVWNDLDDSDIPYFVDISIYDQLNNPELKAHIDRVGKTIYTAPGEFTS
jgi:predicted nucleotidyltransferase